MKILLKQTDNPRVYEITLCDDDKPAAPTITGRLTRTGKHAWRQSLSTIIFPTRDRAIQAFASTALNTRHSARHKR